MLFAVIIGSEIIFKTASKHKSEWQHKVDICVFNKTQDIVIWLRLTFYRWFHVAPAELVGEDDSISDIHWRCYICIPSLVIICRNIILNQLRRLTESVWTFTIDIQSFPVKAFSEIKRERQIVAITSFINSIDYYIIIFKCLRIHHFIDLIIIIHGNVTEDKIHHIIKWQF